MSKTRLLPKGVRGGSLVSLRASVEGSEEKRVVGFGIVSDRDEGVIYNQGSSLWYFRSDLGMWEASVRNFERGMKNGDIVVEVF